MSRTILIALFLALAACNNQPKKGDKPQAYFYAKEGVPLAQYAPQSPLNHQTKGAIKIPNIPYQEYDPTLTEPPQLVDQ